MRERNLDTMQPIVIRAAKAGSAATVASTDNVNLMGLSVVSSDPAAKPSQWFSDGLDTYSALLYPTGTHEVTKKETFSVEGDNAELRHYLARFARKNRCFSRSLEAIKRAVFLFVHAWNARQLLKRKHPDYTIHLIDCLPTLS